MTVQIKSVWWGRPDPAEGFLSIGPMTADRAIEVLQWKKNKLWEEIRQIMKQCPEITGYKSDPGHILTEYINTFAAIQWALEQLDIRATV